MQPTFNTLSTEKKQIVFNALIGMERERSGYWKMRQRMCLAMVVMALLGGWLIADITSQDNSVAAIGDIGKWMMVFGVACGFFSSIALMYAERKDKKDTRECINKASQLGLDPAAFRDEVVELVKAEFEQTRAHSPPWP